MDIETRAKRSQSLLQNDWFRETIEDLQKHFFDVLAKDPMEVKARGQSTEQRRIRQLVGKVSGKKKTGQAYQPSVEGRGLVGIQK